MAEKPADSQGLVYKHPPGFRLRRVRNWFFLGLTYASYYLCRYNLGIVAPEMMKEFGFSKTQYGSIQSARSGAYAIGQFVNGLFTDKLGGKQAMTIGALGTVLLNFLFGWVAWSSIGWLFFALMIVRLADGYVQAFGAPGMVKINTSWFRRQERGTFAGIFGAMINLGQMGVGQLGALIATGFAIPLIFFTITVPKLDWRYMFIIPPFVAMIVVVLMNILVKNHPEEAGYSIVHDDEDPEDHHEETPHLGEVFRRITSNPIVWIVAGAYFCTGFVRTAIYDWWVVYYDQVWGVTKAKDKQFFIILAVWALPMTATIGSLASGVISDKLFRGRRAPVACILYLSQVVFLGLAIAMSEGMLAASAGISALFILGAHTGCNATHSILGTAAAMDLGGRKMAGFAAGVIDSFQYFGAMIAGFGLGAVLDAFVQTTRQSEVVTSALGETPEYSVPTDALLNPTIWFASMIPWALLGAILMGYLWLRYGKSGKAGT